ncbi:MAG: anion permease [Chloroflexi bacterium HGW-Chloroflexi-10]|nr:MAG: anion permease [Chloroflexi bacterium HGW-Chloroflexi-10]
MTLLFILIGLALVFDFLNGFHDSSNIVATIIFSRAMSPRKALMMTAAAEFAGPFLFGVAVAKTIGEDIVVQGSVDTLVLVAALIAAIFWNLFTWYFGIPSSSSHALIGGIIGAVAAGAGIGAIQVSGLIKVGIALFVSPVLGILVGFLITRLAFFLSRSATLRINTFFKNAQVLTGLGLALSHGANDAQKTMGIITLGLVVSGTISSFQVPLWVIAISAGAIALGTAVGGWRLIKTLGGKFYKIKPIHGFTAQISSASIILGAALLGGPVSTTQVVSSAILGAGSAQRVNMVRWGVAVNILVAWVVTIPITIIISFAVYWLLQILFIR